jgi:ABC-type transport system involved in multi-copper enzyme maturation permease subunit
LTFHEARRRRILWVALLLGLAFIALFALGFYFIHREMQREMGNMRQLPEAFNFFLMAGLYVVNFLIVMMAVLTSVDTVAGEIASHTIQAIATKPIQRWEIILGKWLGFAAMLAGYVVLMAGGVMVAVYAIARYVSPNPWQGIGLMYLEGALLLSLSFLGGTRLSTLANGALVFMLYGLAFIGGWIEQIGSLLRNETAVNLGIVASLIMPSEALWRRAAYVLQPPVIRDLGFTPFATTSTPSPAMVVYAGLYVLVTLGGAMWAFSRRDL